MRKFHPKASNTNTMASQRLLVSSAIFGFKIDISNNCLSCQMQQQRISKKKEIKEKWECE